LPSSIEAHTCKGVDRLIAEKQPSSREGYIPNLLGTEFILGFYRLFKGTTLYNRNNAIIDRLTQECLQTIQNAIRSEGHLSLKIIQDGLYFNNIAVQIKADHYSILSAFLQEMKNRWIGELEFTESIGGEQLKDFVYLLSAVGGDNEGNYLYIMKQLESRGIDSVHVGKLEFYKKGQEAYAVSADSKDLKQFSKETYFNTIQLAKEMVDSVKNQKVLNVRKAKRLMQNTVSILMQDESTLLGLAHIKNYDEYTFNHSVNVAIYAMAIGQRVGIPKHHLTHLGLSALFHDIGKAKIPKELLAKVGKLSPEEMALLRAHPLFGAETVMRMKEWGELAGRMIEAAYEHHLKYDLSGYPKPSQKRKLTLFGKIIAIADFYDALVRPRLRNRFPYTSEKIIGIMLERSGKDLDPALVKVFVSMIGVFPLGTLVLLNTNEIGIVIQTPEDSEQIDRPKVRLLYHSDGEYLGSEIVDLREVDEVTLDYKRSIVKTLDPNQYDINVAEFLL
jgi:putative nucleotidyltransferase with HDIG domain